eukprot:TRINITY_DN12226_c0_g1_i1.p1 TRINITY_DN12226_c0_g1~~TRINITY_DN12226_c0_g1_i1.p1  ORF type:complete len:353 (+),score=63.13 TRINITY_DN12226_c0_g1_i1:152-1210(+)
MKSVFVRKDKASTEAKVVFGCYDMDRLLCTKFSKGQTILLIEDANSKLHNYFTRYFIGAGFHAGQDCLVIDHDSERWLNMIPTISSSSDKKEMSEKEEQKTEEKAKIAWRYDNMQTKKVEENLQIDVPKFDMAQQIDLEKDAKFIDKKKLLSLKEARSFESLKGAFGEICTWMQNSLKDPNDKSIKRILVSGLLNTVPGRASNDRDAIKFAKSLKTLIRSSHSVLMLTVRPNAVSKLLENNLIHEFDICLQSSSLNSKEYEDFQGLLTFHSLKGLNRFLFVDLETDIYGVKMERKKIGIEKLYQSLEPEALDVPPTASKGEEEVKTEKGRKPNKSTMLCANNPGGVNPTYEF